MRLLGPVVAAVLVVGIAVQLLSWIAVAAVVYGLYRLGRRLLRQHRARAAAAAHRRAELLARAEIQHRWYLVGDPRGTYGRYLPAA
jgi:hypothetical protein